MHRRAGQLEKKDPALFETYRELICHFNICLDVHQGRGSVNSLKSWTDYLFLVLHGIPEDIQVPVTDEHISR